MLDSNPDLDLNSMSKAELAALQRRVQEALAKSDTRRRRDAIAAAERAVREYGFTLQEIITAAPKANRKGSHGTEASHGAKFRNPENPSETWAGRGRRPAWFKAQVQAGKSENDLRA